MYSTSQNVSPPSPENIQNFQNAKSIIHLSMKKQSNPEKIYTILIPTESINFTSDQSSVLAKAVIRNFDRSSESFFFCEQDCSRRRVQLVIFPRYASSQVQPAPFRYLAYISFFLNYFFLIRKKSEPSLAKSYFIFPELLFFNQNLSFSSLFTQGRRKLKLEQM